MRSQTTDINYYSVSVSRAINEAANRREHVHGTQLLVGGCIALERVVFIINLCFTVFFQTAIIYNASEIKQVLLRINTHVCTHMLCIYTRTRSYTGFCFVCLLLYLISAFAKGTSIKIYIFFILWRTRSAIRRQDLLLGIASANKGGALDVLGAARDLF